MEYIDPDNVVCVKVLMNRGADVNIPNSNGQNTLYPLGIFPEISIIIEISFKSEKKYLQFI